MLSLLTTSKKLRLLVCHNPDGISTQRLVDRITQDPPQFDAVLLTGPFLDKRCESKESVAMGECEVSAIIALLETIVCRVIYLPTELDPDTCLTEQIHLTPNSVAIHGRHLNLLPQLYVMGFSENSLVEESPSRRSRGQSHLDNDDEDVSHGENFTIQHELSCAIIEEMLTHAASPSISSSMSPQALNDLSDFLGPAIEAAAPSKETVAVKVRGSSCGLFMFNCMNSPALSRLLFGMPEQMAQAGVQLLIVNSFKEDVKQVLSRLPKQLPNSNILTLVPGSLRDGYYSVVELEYRDERGAWDVTRAATERL